MEFKISHQKFNKSDIENMPSTSLAFIGDAFFTLLVRTRVLNPKEKSGKLHIKSNNFVNAKAQGECLTRVLPYLTEQENDIVRRARNTHTLSKSKNAGLADYKKATGFEALVGFLFLSQENERLEKLMNLALSEVDS